MRAQTPERLGTMTSRRPAGVSTRHLAEKCSGAFGDFEAVNDEQPVDRIVGEREMFFLDEDRHVAFGRGPDERALACRHQRANVRRVAPERAQERGGKAKAHNDGAVKAAIGC